jgi:hypothetical protein
MSNTGGAKRRMRGLSPLAQAPAETTPHPKLRWTMLRIAGRNSTSPTREEVHLTGGGVP